MAVSAARGALEDITVGVGRVLGAVWRASLCLPSLLRARSPGGRKQISQSTTAAFNLRSHWPRDQPKKEERGRITRGHTPTIVAPPTRPAAGVTDSPAVADLKRKLDLLAAALVAAIAAILIRKFLRSLGEGEL